MTHAFREKVAVVTGGGSGIGRAAALSFAQRGAKVVVVGRTRDKIEDTVERIEASGGEAVAVQADVSIDEQVQSTIDETVRRFGRLDFACNAAAINGAFVHVTDVTEADVDAIIAVNLKGVWLCMKHQIPYMLAQKSGVIVNISSINGLSGTKNAPIYAASKYGVIGLTKSAALEYADRNIRVNCICPGAVQTPGLEEAVVATGISNRIIESEVPMGRIGEPEEIANVVSWLCSDEASFVTGHVMVVDGGETA